MSQQLQLSYKKHVQYIPLTDPSIVVECAILRKTPTGDTFYFTIESLDAVDRKRLVNILSRQNSHTLELWEVMQHVMLNNGINALDYFHQLAMVKTASGAIMKPTLGRMGVVVPKPNSVSPSQTNTVPTQGKDVVKQTAQAKQPVESAPTTVETINNKNVEDVLRELNITQ